MKTRSVLKRELDEAKRENSRLQDQLTAAQDVATEKVNTADRERAATLNAERERGEAVAARDAAMETAARMARDRDETLVQRDEWAKTAEANARGRDEAQTQVDALNVALLEVGLQRDEAVRAAQDALKGSEQSRLEGEQALAEVQRALEDCRRSRGIVQTQRDTILAAAAEQGIMIPMPGGPARREGPIGYDVTKPLAGWDRDQHVVIGGEAVPTVVGGHAVPIIGYEPEPTPAGARVLIEHWQGVAKRLEAERDEQRAAHEQWRSDCLVARDGYSELHTRLTAMMSERDVWSERAETHEQERDQALAERDAAVATLEREREQGLLPPDETRQGYASYRAMRDTLALVERERDAVRAAHSEAVESLRQVKAERDELRPLAALSDPVTAQMKIAEATVRVDRAEAEFANLTRERDEARADAERARSLAMDSMMVDGALENALGKLVGVLGVEAYESPADVIDSATDALKDARREAGRLKLVLDIIDERKASEPVEVERRGHDGA